MPTMVLRVHYAYHGAGWHTHHGAGWHTHHGSNEGIPPW